MIHLKKSLAAASAIAALSGAALSSAVTQKATAKTVAKSKKVAKATTGTAAASKAHTAETPLTGDTAAKVSAAALASTGGGTVIRAETNTDGGGAYEAHVRKADGTEVIVLVDESFKVVGTQAAGHGGRGHGDGHRGGNHPALTGDTLTKATAAALAKTGGGTVERTEADTHGGGAYEVHVLKTDGTRVEVVLDSVFAVVAVETH